ncbi:excisionase family DNA binding protein [Bradyrhizobium sp. LB14.3]|uniref:helix-turn-helix domain-containing protein n=1 Tax=Bradyrhizobium sp. LB14.3 TaxID=3156328 RepID=UPI00339B850E
MFMDTQPPPQTLTLTINEACVLAHISRGTLYKAMQSGALLGRKLGTKTIVLRTDLQLWLEALPPVYDPKAKRATAK